MPYKFRQDWDKNHRFEENEQESLKKRWIVKDKKTVKMSDVGGGATGATEPLVGGSGTFASAAATCNVSH